jgi:integrase
MRFLDYINGCEIEKPRSTSFDYIKYEKLAVKYLKAKRDNAADLMSFIRFLSDAGTPPQTIHIKQVSVRQWLIENDVEFTEKDKVRLRRITPRGGRRTNIKYADVQIVRDIVAHSDVRLKALVLVLASSGMRIGEALSVKWSQVRIPDRMKERDREKLTEIFIGDSKNQTSRRVWITREAEESLLAWKSATRPYLKTVSLKGENLGITRDSDDEDYIFPFCKSSVYAAWDAACKAAGHYTKDEKTRRNQLNIHRLRGFFKTQTMTVIPGEISELLLGHSDAYGNAYNGLSDSKLEQEYQRCESALTVASPHGIARQMEKQAEEVALLKNEIRDLRDALKRQWSQKGFPTEVMSSSEVGAFVELVNHDLVKSLK